MNTLIYKKSGGGKFSLNGMNVNAFIKSIVDVTNPFLRKSDIFSRWGGDEFILLLKNCSIEDAYNISENIRSEIKKIKVTFKDNDIFSTVSMGVSEYRLGEEMDKVICRADKALYLSKRNGRDKVEKGI